MALVADILNSPDVQSGLVTILTLTLSAVIAFVGKRYHTLLDRKVSQNTLDFLNTLAAGAVAYAEQTGATASGEEKLAAAEGAVKTQLDAAHITLDPHVIRAAIEAAVFTGLNDVGPLVTSDDPPPPSGTASPD